MQDKTRPANRSSSGRQILEGTRRCGPGTRSCGGPRVAGRIKSMEGQPRDRAFSSGRGNTGRNELTIGPWPPFIARGSCRRVRGDGHLTHALYDACVILSAFASLSGSWWRSSRIWAEELLQHVKRESLPLREEDKSVRAVCARDPVWPSGKALGW